MPMMSNLERLAHMANQIARNFETLGHERAVVATADHLAKFWDPRMKAQIRACLERGAHDLGATAASAVQRLTTKDAPPPRNHTANFDGAADAR